MKTPAFWERRGVLSHALLPLSWLYGAGAALGRTRRLPERAPIPVLSIGNVTAGGAGKTPATLALVPLLQALGLTPHILTRGYKARHALHAHRVTPGDDWQSVGDEALLLAQAAPTWVGAARLASARAAADAGASVALCDDALQHHALKKTLSLLVIDGPYGLGNGRLLPAGPLREPLTQAAARCDAVILIGEDRQNLTTQISLPVFQATLAPSQLPPELTATHWLAFAGIGRPQKFFDTLRATGATLAATRAFPDHHAYSIAELESLQREADSLGARLITTEKDAVKLPSEWRARVATLPVALRFAAPEMLQQFLQQKLHNA